MVAILLYLPKHLFFLKIVTYRVPIYRLLSRLQQVKYTFCGPYSTVLAYAYIRLFRFCGSSILDSRGHTTKIEQSAACAFLVFLALERTNLNSESLDLNWTALPLS